MSRASGDDPGGGPPPPHGTYWVVAGEFLAGPYPGSTNPAEHRAKVAALVVACWLIRYGLARGNNVLEEIRHLRRAEQERGSRPSPETEAQRRFLVAWQEGT